MKNTKELATLSGWLAPLLIAAVIVPVGNVHADDSTSDGDVLDSLFAPSDSSGASESEPEASTEETEESSAESDGENEPGVIALPEEQRAPLKEPPRTTALEEIVVTATKRERSVRDLVGSVDAFSGDALMEKGAIGLEEILKFSPGVTTATSTDGESSQISFRGIRSESGSSLFGRTFGLFYDDVSLINPTFRGAQPDFDPWDMASVEVLKGPQGTLFGGGALSGAVRYVPQLPEFSEFYGVFSTSYIRSGHSEDQGFAERLSLNMPVNDAVAFRAAGSWMRRPGYVDDTFREKKDINSSERFSGRALARWEPTSRLAINLQVIQRRFESDDGNAVDNLERPETDSRRISDYTDSRLRIIKGDISYDLGWASLKTQLSQVDKNYFYFGDATKALDLEDSGQTVFQSIKTETTQPSLEVRLTSSRPTSGGFLFGGWDYLLGLYLVQSDQQLEIFINPSDPATPAGPVDVPGTGDEETTALYSYGGADAVEQAVFFDLNRQLTDTLELSMGARLFKQESEALMYDQAEGEDIQRTQATPKDEGISPKIGLIWRFRENMSLVTSAARGFRYGGINILPATSTAPKTYKSDYLWNYELGLRTDWLDKRLQLDLTTFYIDWTDLQISQLTQPDELFVYVGNVGAARSHGAEIGMRAALPWGLMLQSGASYTDARTQVSFESSDGTIPPGTRLPASPYYSGYLSLASTTYWGPATLRGEINTTQQGSSTNGLKSTITLPAYNTVGMSLASSWDGYSLAPELRLNVTNLLNKTVVGYARGSEGDYRATFIQPRTATLTLQLRF